jgi:outer membrane protein TolC
MKYVSIAHLLGSALLSTTLIGTPFCVVPVLLFQPAHADTGLSSVTEIDERPSLSLPEAQARLFTNNFELNATALDKARAENQWRESRAAWSPSLDLGAQYNVLSEKSHLELQVPIPPNGLRLERDLGSHERWETGIDITYPLFTGFARGNQIEARRQAATSQGARYAALRQQASLRLAGLHFAWRSASASLQFQDAQCALAEGRWKNTEAQRKQGIASDRMVLAAHSQWLVAENDRLIALHQVDSLQGEAVHWLGGGLAWVWAQNDVPWNLPESLSLPASSEASELSDAPREASLIQPMRPELQSLQAQKASLQASEKALQGQNWPTLAAMAGLRYANPGLNLAGTEPMGYALAGMQLKWNLWDGGRLRSQRQEMRLKQEQVDLESARWNEEWRKAQTLAARQYRRWRHQATTAQAALDAAERGLIDARKSLTQGLTTPLDTLEAFAQAARAHMLQSQAEAMQRLTYCQWLYARGDSLNFNP